MANVKITELTAITAPATTDVLPIVDVTADTTKKVSVADLLESAGDGAAATPAFSFASDKNIGMYRVGADQLGFATAGVQALYINADGNILVADGNRMEIDEIRARDGAGLKLFDDAGSGIFVQDGGAVGIGTSSPAFALDISASSDTVVRSRTNGNTSAGFIGSTNNGTNNWFFGSRKDATGGSSGTDRFNLLYDTNTFLTVTTAGNVGIGTTSPSQRLTVGSGSGPESIVLYTGTGNTGELRFSDTNSTYQGALVYGHNDNSMQFLTNGVNERMRIDSSGRLLVGTSTSRSTVIANPQFQVEGTGYSGSSIQMICNSAADAYTCSHLAFGRTKTTSIGGTGQVVNGDRLGAISWNGAQNSSIASIAGLIECYVDGGVQTGGDTTDMPGRLVFSTTADGASSPTERMRITSGGDVLISKDTSSFGTDGIVLGDDNFIGVTRTSATPLSVIRNGTDGTLVNFEAQNVVEGSISVSGTTVSYNGAHLARWSQLASGAARTEILRGSVLSNLDEMCEWGEEDNEQLNRMKVSDVEGDRNVSGVFQAWDDDDDTYTNDFYCAMTGDFVIRIAQGTTVARGDLLMSAGDGTAKPQDDDIVRSKTIAKVTSTTVSETYSDGSYCVPCVLMAC